MKKSVLILLNAFCCFGYQSIKVSANGSVAMTIPNAAPFTSLGDYRIAFRLHDWKLPNSGQVTILNFGNAQVVLTASGQLCGVDNGDAQSWGNQVCVSVVGLNDVVGRVQRFTATFPVHDPSPGSSWFEAQDLSSGKVLAMSCGNWTPTGCPIDEARANSVVGGGGIGGGVEFSMSWLKWFSTAVAPGSGFENEATAADLGDWRFEGNYLNEGTGEYGVALSGGGGVRFVGSPVKGPACNLTRQIFRAGFAGQLSSNAYALDGSGGIGYEWQQLTGPTQLMWRGQGTSSASISGGVFGSYTIQLTVTDGSGQKTSCRVKDGFVATDGNGVVVSANPAVDELVGPQIQLGKNPWSWYDDRHVAEAELQMGNLGKYYSLGGTAPWNAAGVGTIATANNSLVIRGAGTNFLSTFCPEGGKPPAQGSFIEIWYPNAGVPGGTGRRLYAVGSCASDTELTMAGEPWNDMGLLLSGSGWNYSWVDGNVWGMWFFNNSPADYYDVVAALYALYYRSGIDDYQNAARLFADNIWQFKLDSGWNYQYGEGFNTFPRNRGILGMVLRALDGRPDMWSGLEMIANFDIAQNHGWFGAYGDWTQIQGLNDPREDGYQLMEESYCALYDPNAAGAARCRGGAGELMNRGWTPSRFPDGNWYSLYYTWPYSSWDSGTGITLTKGSGIGTCVDGKNACSWTTKMFPNVWWFTKSATSAPRGTPYGNSDGDGKVYYPVMVDSKHIQLQDINGNAVAYEGESGVHGWAVGTVSGQVGFGVQPYMYGILGTAFDFAAKATTCGSSGPANCDDQVARNAHEYNVAVANYLRTSGYWGTTKGMYYSASFVECTPPISDSNPGCTGGNTADQARVLNAEALRGVMTAYAYNRDENLRAFGDELYTAMWGKPGYSLPVGIEGDGKYIWDYNDGYGFDMVGAPPAGMAHKYFGMGWGIGAGSSWPGYRMGGAQIGSMVKASIAVDLASVSGATTANLEITYPNGLTASQPCSTFPCQVILDQLQGNPVVQVQYRSATGQVLATQSAASMIALN